MSEDRVYRITDVSGISPGDIRTVNLEFLNRDESPYDIPPGRTTLGVRKDVRRVEDGDLQRLFDEFPFEQPLQDQCALWFHAVAGNHFFPDANHRTAVSTLRELLSQNDLEESVEWPTEQLVETIKESKRIRQTVTIDLGSLYERTRLYDHWHQFFRQVLSLPDP
jgi:prophage maintenance system killer protein